MGNRPLEIQLSGMYRLARTDSLLSHDVFYGEYVSNTTFRNFASRIIGRSISDLSITDVVMADVPRHPKPTARNILSYYGIEDMNYQNEIMLCFSGDYREGVKIIQQAFQLAHYHGLEGNFLATPTQVADTFVLIASCIYEYGLLPTNAILERTGLGLFPISINKTKTIEHSLRQPESNISKVSMN